MPFDPQTDGYPYPRITDQHYLKVEERRHFDFDEHYNYIDESRSFKFKRFWFDILLALVMFPITAIRMNLRIKGRENLKKYRKELEDGAITVSNHVHMWDCPALMLALREPSLKVLVWNRNLMGGNRIFIRMSGGIPVPAEDPAAMEAMYFSVVDYLKRGNWLHVYSEGSMWEFYQPIRPFKDGAARFSYATQKPILPIAFSYRKNGFIRKKIFNSPASLTINIGEPIWPDPNVHARKGREQLTIRVHEAVCRLAGIDPKENIYPPVFNQNERIDYYTSEYGVGYKNSW